MEMLHRQAAADQLPELTLEAMESLWRRLPSSKAKGVDVLSPTDLQRLPNDAKFEIVGILNQVELQGPKFS